MNLNVVTPPSEEPVSTAEAKKQMRVDVSDEDALIDAMVSAARDVCEGLAKRAFVTQTLSITLDEWPESPFDLPRPPLRAVNSITYKDETGNESTMSADDYVVDLKSTPGRLALADGASWPSGDLYPIGAITIEFEAGYGAASAVPEIFKTAVKLLAAHWYENREATVPNSYGSVEIPFGVKVLLKSDPGEFKV